MIIHPVNGGSAPFTDCDGTNDCSNTLAGQWNALPKHEARDIFYLEFETLVPAGTHGYALDLAFFTSHYPQWSNDAYNDMVVLWSQSEAYVGSISYLHSGDKLKPLSLPELTKAGWPMRDGAVDPTLAGTGYDWLLLEMYDQVVRNHSGGAMAECLRQPAMVNQDFVVGRIGRVARDLMAPAPPAASPGVLQRLGAITPAKLAGWVQRQWRQRFGGEALRVGSFRLGGEPHLWMYDRYSLGRALQQVGFVDVQRVDPQTSAIADWARYELDVRDGAVLDPTSLFMEARKPLGTHA